MQDDLLRNEYMHSLKKHSMVMLGIGVRWDWPADVSADPEITDRVSGTERSKRSQKRCVLDV